MRRVKVELEELISLLEQMRDSGGTKEVIIFDYDGMPALCDAEEEDNIIAFASDPDDVDEDSLH